MIKLIPFNSTIANRIMDWQLDRENARFFRGIQRLLTFEECERFPDFAGETFVITEAGDIVGICYFQHKPYNIAEFGLLIDGKHRSKKKCVWAVIAIEDYLFKVRNVRKIMFYVSPETGVKRMVEEDLCYRLVGTLQQHSIVNGRYEDLLLYEKLR